jgi:hypothetical protein
MRWAIGRIRENPAYAQIQERVREIDELKGPGFWRTTAGKPRFSICFPNGISAKACQPGFPGMAS